MRRGWESNPRPPDHKSDTLNTEPRGAMSSDSVKLKRETWSSVRNMEQCQKHGAVSETWSSFRNMEQCQKHGAVSETSSSSRNMDQFQNHGEVPET
ncbi:hypothetical protein ElyMa_001360400 [Elysia marginata]|uniref:Uncharacterized protein n=1 Tax=Elysia marginata TaxID=1093978 RepID=A0AAV4IRW0_9GAST|nr:hypothetical protein ElyMa_001360400 [Elysia marginata]